MITLPSTLIVYLWAVLVWQWYKRLCLIEECLKWQRRSKIPPNARCVPWYDFSTQKVNVQRNHKQIVAVYGKVMNRQNVTKWCREFCEGRTDVHDEQKSGRTSLSSRLAGLWIGAAIWNTSHSNKAGFTSVKRARLTGRGSRSTAVLP